MYRSFLLAPALATALFANAQLYTHQVLVLNEGHYDFNTQTQDVPVTLGSYNPATGTYSTVATIADARFGNAVVVDGHTIYVGADTRLLKYDADTYALLDEAEVPGIRSLAVWNNALVITRGEVGGLPYYLEVRDKHTLDELYHLDAATLPYSCEAVQVVGDQAFIAVNNGFDWGNAVGLLGVLDMNSQTWSTLDLGPDGINPEHIMVVDGAVYTFNNKDYTGSSISKYQPGGVAVDYTHNVALSSGCGASAATTDRIYFLEYAQNVLNRYDLATAAVLDTLDASPATYGLIDDPNNGVMYGTTTDFLTSGELHVMNYEGQILSSVAVGVSPGKLALDTRLSTGITTGTTVRPVLYPNPATDMLSVSLSAAHGNVPFTLHDAAGRTVLQGAMNSSGTLRIDVSDLAAGVYTLHTVNGATARFIKR
ncbi:MAG TPA: T9SS type A sorting domain-containing protein [Flavobacteriales bacterium]|nr:T9SS type A sorting domain-containing protein [Flavobacteriales bacterium]HMW96764.1 T9SS type A sorting domain-containing protein [Flavobacteriales bacterium]HNE79241.1 T9SS type A sorting domain-containing protein [Flavobacteriales bacterium]HNI05740.1 T9SS type A sorting domain-containing protein [Flavobacteriales bacterium]HNM70820.1 T9SS type A sorting domain-containing protein [Flavobacteriales bacterium]